MADAFDHCFAQKIWREYGLHHNIRCSVRNTKAGKENEKSHGYKYDCSENLSPKPLPRMKRNAALADPKIHKAQRSR